uniref:Putative conserved secreted protein n=1 Tax=Culex tarsalis TaxID=7177 RepID=A0A1Q3FT79_CULTA
MFCLKVVTTFLLITALCCHANFTNRQKRIIHSHVEECAADLGIKEYDKLEVLGVSGRQTSSDETVLRLMHCLILRLEFIDCDGVFSMDNFAAFISDGHDNMDQLPAVFKECVDRVKGTPEQKSFQLYRCLFSQHKFEM